MALIRNALDETPVEAELPGSSLVLPFCDPEESVPESIVPVGPLSEIGDADGPLMCETKSTSPCAAGSPKTFARRVAGGLGL